VAINISSPCDTNTPASIAATLERAAIPTCACTHAVRGKRMGVCAGVWKRGKVIIYFIYHLSLLSESNKNKMKNDKKKQ
jgi:C4-dicarboxylate transporter